MSLKNLIFPSALAAAIMAATAIGSLFFATPSYAQSHHALREASECYRDAALAFERHIYSNRWFDQYDRRVADQLEQAARDFRSAARNPRDLERLLHFWDDLSSAHFRAERLVRGCGHPDPALLECWRPVAEDYLNLVTEMRCLSGQHGHASHRVPFGDHHDQMPNRHLPSYPSHFPGHYPGHPGDVYGSAQAPLVLPEFGVHASPQPAPPRSWQHTEGWQGPRGGRDEFRGSFQPQRLPGVDLRTGNPRGDIGAAIAATLLERLLN